MPAKLAGLRKLRTVLEIDDGRGKQNRYKVLPIRSDRGTGWRLLKVGMQHPSEVLATYEILRDASKRDMTCTCQGYSRWGYCKHTDSLKTLIGDFEDVGSEPSRDRQLRAPVPGA